VVAGLGPKKEAKQGGERRRRGPATAPRPPERGKRGGGHHSLSRLRGEGGQNPLLSTRSDPAAPLRGGCDFVAAGFGPSRDGWSSARILTLAREKVSLGPLGIPELRIKSSQSGGRVLEVPGEDSAARADRLAAKLSEALAATPARVYRPAKTAEVRITELEETVTLLEVETALSNVGGCSISEVRVGPIKPGPGGAGSVWAQCPVTTANRLTAAGRVCVGWTMARVQLLAARPLQCFHCLALGHARAPHR